MKYIFFIIPLFALLLASGCAHKQATPKVTKIIKHLDLSKINYPKEVGSYTLFSKEKIKNNDNAIMIRYVDYKHAKAFMDCYIYPQGRETNITTHYQDFLSGLNFMLKKGEFKKLTTLKEDKVSLDQNTTALRTLFEMQNKNVAYYSTLYLAPLEDHYFKVRLSNPLTSDFPSSDLGEKDVKELFKNLRFNP